jgi:hypothetical protein
MWASGLDPKKRADSLKELCEQFGFFKEAELYAQELSLLEGWRL